MGKETTKTKTITRGSIIQFEQNGDYFYQKGLKAYQQRQLSKAVRLFEKAVSVAPMEASYISQLALTLAELQEYEESNFWLQKLVNEIDPTMNDCYFFMANNYAHLGMYYEAKCEANRYLEHPNDGSFVEDAEDLLDLLMEEFAEDELEEMVEEEQVLVKHEKAKVLIEQNNYDDAIELLQELIDEHATFWPAYNNLALAYYYLNDFNKAFDVLDLLLEKNPGNLHGLCNLALMYDHVGYEQHKEELLNRLKNITPISPEHRFKLGTTFGVLGYHTDAFRWFYSLKNYGMQWGASYYHWLAVSAFLSDKNKIAENAWRRILSLDPDGEVAPYFLSKLEAGSLGASEVDYYYRKPQAKNVDDAGMESGFVNKLSHLYLASVARSEYTNEMLETFCLNNKEALILKEIAAHLLLGNKNEATIVEQGEKLTFDEPILWVEKGFGILDKVQAFVAEGSTKVEPFILQIWFDLLEEARVSDGRFLTNTEAWAGAIAYLFMEEQPNPKTRKELASIFQISTATLGKYINKLEDLLSRKYL